MIVRQVGTCVSRSNTVGQQVLRAVIADISGITNITDIADVADIVTDITDITTDIADIADIMNIQILRWRQVSTYKVLLGCPMTECS
jgi:hypothetical protein